MRSDLSGNSWVAILILGAFLVAASTTLMACSAEEKNWPTDIHYSYADGGREGAGLNCYSFAFDYNEWAIPGASARAKDHYFDGWDCVGEIYNEYTMTQAVLADAYVRNKKVESLSSLEWASDDAYLVVCKLTDDGSEYHFAVKLPNGDWVDKPGNG